MLDEPPQVEQTIRDAGRVGWDAIDDWEAYGAGSAFFGCGGTMHGNPQFQRCEVPTDPAIVACVEAFVRGFSRVPVQRYHGYKLIIGWVAAHGGPTFTDDQVVKFVAEATPVLAVVAWSVYTKYFGRLKLNTALFEAQKTEKQLEAQVRDPDYTNPSILTQKHEIPQLPQPK
jgi:hypothetical protein